MFMVVLVVLVAPPVLLIGAILLPVAFLLSFGGSRPWTAWGRGVLVALTGLCVASLVGLFTAGGLVMDAGDVCFPALQSVDDWSDGPYPTLRTELFPFHAVCDNGRSSVDLVPDFVNPTLAVCAIALPVLTVGAVVSRLRRVDSPGPPSGPPRVLPWVLAGLGLAAGFLILTGFVLFAVPVLVLLGATVIVLGRRRVRKARSGR